MGVTLTRDGEIDVVRTGSIIYKDIDFQEVTEINGVNRGGAQ
jgi:hypothetical protein